MVGGCRGKKGSPFRLKCKVGMDFRGITGSLSKTLSVPFLAKPIVTAVTPE